MIEFKRTYHRSRPWNVHRLSWITTDSSYLADCTPDAPCSYYRNDRSANSKEARSTCWKRSMHFRRIANAWNIEHGRGSRWHGTEDVSDQEIGEGLVREHLLRSYLSWAMYPFMNWPLSVNASRHARPTIELRSPSEYRNNEYNDYLELTEIIANMWKKF